MRKILLLFFCSIQICVNAQVFNITSFGAVGDGSTMNTAAIQAAVDSCNHAGGGVVEVPAGNFLTATIFLKSNVTLQLDSGATITGSSSTSDYPDVVPQIRSYADNYPQRSVFYAENQHNIAITGKGTFNGNGLSVSFLLDSHNKPYGFRFISCTNIRYDGPTLKNSGFWMMHNQNCDTVVLKNLTIINQAFGNNDGIDLDGCSNALVDSCYADCNDDPMVMKTTSPAGCHNIEIRNSTFATYSRGLKMGTESSGAFDNIHIHNCNVVFSTHGPFGSNSPGKCGINLAVVDGGSMENILIENINISGVNTPVCIRLGNRANKYTDTAAVPGVGYMRDVELRNIIINASSDSASSITGIPGYDARNIKLENIDVTYPGGWPSLGPGFVVPENISAGPEATLFGDSLPASGLFIRHIDSLQMHNVCFHAIQPDSRPDFYLDDVNNLDTAGLCGSVENVTAIQQPGLSNDIAVYPNPVLNTFQIKTDNSWLGASYKLFDINGKIVLQGIIRLNKQTVEGNQVPAGLYLLQLAKGAHMASKRVLKM